jgi:hypothetical protein
MWEDGDGCLLAWADRAARALLPTPYGRPVWFIALPEGGPDRRPALEAAGFAAQDEGENAWSQVMLALDAGTILVQTDNYRDRAYNFYRTAGFQVAEHVAIFRKDYAPEE